jgi:hypothetical protein
MTWALRASGNTLVQSLKRRLVVNGRRPAVVVALGDDLKGELGLRGIPRDPRAWIARREGRGGRAGV